MYFVHISQVDANLPGDPRRAPFREQRDSRRRAGRSESVGGQSRVGPAPRAAGRDPLLVRAGRRMVPTPRGERLAPRVHRVVEEMNALFQDDAEFDPAALRRAFRVHTTDHSPAGPIARPRRHLDRGGARRRSPYQLDRREQRRGSSAPATSTWASGCSPTRRARVCRARRFSRTALSASFARSIRSSSASSRSSNTPPCPTFWSLRAASPPGCSNRLLAERGYRRRVARAIPHFLVAPFLIARSDYVLTVSERLAHTFAGFLDLQIVAPPLSIDPYTLYQCWHRRNDDRSGSPLAARDLAARGQRAAAARR